MRESPDGELDRGEGDEGEQGVGEVSSSLARRRFRPNQENVRSTTQRRGNTTKPVMSAVLDDLDPGGGDLGDGLIDLAGVVAAVRPDQLEPGEAGADLVENEGRAIAILEPGGVDDDTHGQFEGVDQGVDLAALYLLAGVVTHGVVFTAPFSADFSDWLSRTAAVGLAS